MYSPEKPGAEEGEPDFAEADSKRQNDHSGEGHEVNPYCGGPETTTMFIEMNNMKYVSYVVLALSLICETSVKSYE